MYARCVFVQYAAVSTESNLVTAQNTANEPLKMVVNMDRNM